MNSPRHDRLTFTGSTVKRSEAIDIEVALQSGRRWVVQCKACKGDVLKYLRRAVKDFLPHLDFWKEKGVEKFIVAVGCAADEARALDAKRAYEEQLGRLGLAFEL